MNFKQILDKAHKEAIDIACAYVAQEVSEYELSACILAPEEFEEICRIVHSIWINYKYSVSDIVDAVMHLYQVDKIPLDSINDEKVLKSL